MSPTGLGFYGLTSGGVGLVLSCALKGAILLGIAWVTVAAMKRSSAAMRHMVWLVALNSLLFLPVLSVVMPGWRVLPGWMGPVLEQSRIAKDEVLPSTITEASKARLPEVLEMPSGVTINGTSGAMAGSISNVERANQPMQTRRLDARAIFSLVWAAGMILVLAPSLLGLLSLWRVSRRSRDLAEVGWRKALGGVCAELGLRQRVRLLVTSERQMPMTWGILKGKILLAEEALQWEEACRRNVLLHEVAHVKRRDCLTNLVSRVVCAIYWFNPLVWLAARRIAGEQELACDDVVVKAGARRPEFAEQLLQIASRFRVRGMAGSTAIAMARPRALEGRLRAILDEGRNRRGLSMAAVLGCITMLTFVLVPLSLLHAAEFAKVNQANMERAEKGQGLRLVMGIEYAGTGAERERVAQQCMEVQGKRLDAAGITNKVLQAQGGGEIEIWLAGLPEERKEEVRALVQKTGLLEFRMVHPKSQELLDQEIREPGYEALREEITKPDGGKMVTTLLVKKQAERGLTSKYIKRAFVSHNPVLGEPVIDFELNEEGKRLFAEVTREYSPKGDKTWRLAMVSEKKILSAPTIRSEIPSGRGQITGHFDMKEAKLMATALMNRLPCPVRIKEESSLRENGDLKSQTQSTNREIVITSDSGVTYDQTTGLATYTKRATIKWGQAVVTSDRAILNEKSGVIAAEGNVDLQCPFPWEGPTWRCDKVTVYTKTGRIIGQHCVITNKLSADELELNINATTNRVLELRGNVSYNGPEGHIEASRLVSSNRILYAPGSVKLSGPGKMDGATVKDLRIVPGQRP